MNIKDEIKRDEYYETRLFHKRLTTLIKKSLKHHESKAEFVKSCRDSCNLIILLSNKRETRQFEFSLDLSGGLDYVKFHIDAAIEDSKKIFD